MSETILEYVDHKDNCDFLQPMWHQGPCDCGLFSMMDKMSADQIQELRAGLVQSWKDYNTRKASRL